MLQMPSRNPLIHVRLGAGRRLVFLARDKAYSLKCCKMLFRFGNIAAHKVDLAEMCMCAAVHCGKGAR